MPEQLVSVFIDSVWVPFGWLLTPITFVGIPFFVFAFVRRSQKRAWEAVFIRTVRQARAAGITPTEDDTVYSLQRKIDARKDLR